MLSVSLTPKVSLFQIIPDNTRLPIGGSAMLCDGLGGGAQHIVRNIEHWTTGSNRHDASASELRAVSETELAVSRHQVVDYTEEAGQLSPANHSVFGEHWQQAVLGLFGSQKYKPRSHSHYGEEDSGPTLSPAQQIAQNYEHGMPPSDFIFPAQPLPKASCEAVAARLCGGTAQRRSATACDACCGEHMVELVTAGCTDAAITGFCAAA